MKKTIIVAAIAVAALTGASSASATIITQTYRGLFNDTLDSAGLFGTVGLITTPFLIQYTFDTTKGTYTSGTNPPADTLLELQNGGSYLGTISPVSASITINGVTVDIDGNYYGDVDFEKIDPTNDLGRNGIYSSVGASASEIYDDGITTTDYTISNFAFNTTAQSIFSDIPQETAANSLYIAGQIRLFKTDDRTGAHLVYIQGDIGPETVEITSNAPEPSTWALLLGGFGMAGAALRRRRALVTA